MSTIEAIGDVDSGGVEGLSSEELQGGWLDAASDKVNALATNMMRFFWKGGENYRYIFRAPLEGDIGQEDSKTVEIGKRFLLGCAYFPVVVIGTPVAIYGHIFSSAGNLFNFRQYRYLSGEGPQNLEESSKVLHLNTRMFPGPYSASGLPLAGERLEDLAHLIKQEEPDIVCLSEVSRTVTGKLYHQLKADYPHFFIDIGLSGLGVESGLFVATRDPLITPPVFVPLQTSQEGDRKLFNSGLFLFETQKCWYIYTHLHPKDSERAREIRQEQLDEAMEEIKKRGEGKPFVLLGDLNIDKISSKDDYQKVIERGFTDPRADNSETISQQLIDSQLEGEKKTDRKVVDYILYYPDETALTIQTKTIDTLELGLSDHNALVAVVKPYEAPVIEEVTVETPVITEEIETGVEEEVPAVEETPVVEEEVPVEIPVVTEEVETGVEEEVPVVEETSVVEEEVPVEIPVITDEVETGVEEEVPVETPVVTEEVETGVEEGVPVVEEPSVLEEEVPVETPVVTEEIETGVEEEVPAVEETPVIEEEVPVETPVVTEEIETGVEEEVPAVEETSVVEEEVPVEIPVVTEEVETGVEEEVPVVEETPVLEEEVPVEIPVVTEEVETGVEEEVPVVEETPMIEEEIPVETPVITEEIETGVEEEVPAVDETLVVEEEVPVETPVVIEEVETGVEEEVPAVEETPVVEEEVPVETPVITEEIETGVEEEVPVVEETPMIEEEIPVETPVITEEIETGVEEEVPVVEETPMIEEEIPVEIPVVTEEVETVMEEAPVEPPQVEEPTPKPPPPLKLFK